MCLLSFEEVGYPFGIFVYLFCTYISTRVKISILWRNSIRAPECGMVF